MKRSSNVRKVKREAGRDPWGKAAVKKPSLGASTTTKGLYLVKNQAKKIENRGGDGSQPPQYPRSSALSSKAEREGKRTSRPVKSQGGRKGFLLVLSLIALIIVTLVLLDPVLRYVKSSRDLHQKEKELEREKERTAELEERKAQAEDLNFLEREARKLGYVKPGEIPIKIVEERQERSRDGENSSSPPQ